MHIPASALPTCLGGLIEHKHEAWLQECVKRLQLTNPLPDDYFSRPIRLRIYQLANGSRPTDDSDCESGHDSILVTAASLNSTISRLCSTGSLPSSSQNDATLRNGVQESSRRVKHQLLFDEIDSAVADSLTTFTDNRSFGAGFTPLDIVVRSPGSPSNDKRSHQFWDSGQIADGVEGYWSDLVFATWSERQGVIVDRI
ncbi:unnamed protein product [Protopolystoma xenopodis]|uniref:Uncharacterized protein n=1 Tax=Protopolystoma xenopodis TaxID=117903 RepID=A0A448WDD3_9PLAT|nr:unnamed protein product [Protopolystoma xenopodis]